MRNPWTGVLISGVVAFALPVFAAVPEQNRPSDTASYTLTSETLKNITPLEELNRLKAGNTRFVHNQPIQRNLLQQAKDTHLKGQFPAAIILSCMDSRGSTELIFDQGLGDIFSVRVAGNVVDTDQIGSMEYATKVIGSKLIVILGHTQCGAIKGACEGVKLGNLTALLNKIQPAVEKVKAVSGKRMECNHNKTIDHITQQNVLNMMQQIKEKSPIIHDQVNHKHVLIMGAIHDLQSGKVVFFDETGGSL